MSENTQVLRKGRLFSLGRMIRRIRRFLMVVGALISGIAIGILILAFVMAGDLYDYQDTVDGVHLPKVDAIVCLAGGRGRISSAGDIWYRYWELTQGALNGANPKPVQEVPPVLYISGMGKQANWTVFARQLRHGVKDVISPEYVVLEKESANTEANAIWMMKFAKEKNWQRVLLVTSPYHMKRSRFIFDQIFKASSVPIAFETLSVFQEPFEQGEWRSGLYGIKITMQEYFKWIYYRYFWTP